MTELSGWQSFVAERVVRVGSVPEEGDRKIDGAFGLHLSSLLRAAQADLLLTPYPVDVDYSALVDLAAS